MAPQEWSATSPYIDRRTFGAQQARLLDDLNRPDLASPVPEYLRDAIRYFRRKPFYFSDTDNTPSPLNAGGPGPWQASLQYTQGATIQAVASDSNTYVYVQVAFGSPPANAQVGIPTNQSGVAAPVFTPVPYILPTSAGFPQFSPTQPGITQDNQCLWANAGLLANSLGQWSGLATVPNWNQLQPPIDYIAPRLIEITVANLRYELIPLSYRQLRSYDVIRPAPVTSYPIFWTWYAQRIYLWPYALGFYPITLSYRSAWLLPYDAMDINYWTTEAERMIRVQARSFINRDYLGNHTQADIDEQEALREFRALKAHGNNQQSFQRIPMGSW